MEPTIPPSPTATVRHALLQRAARHRRALFLGGMLLAYLLVLWQSTLWVGRDAIDQLAEKGRNQLNLYVSHLRGLLAKYEYLPALLSTNADARDLLRHPADAARVDRLNRYLETIANIAGASDIYLMDHDGLTLAASNWHSDNPFVGRNFGWRPYFRQALQGRLGRYFALGITSLKRGYYFAYAVRAQGAVLGAVVVKLDMTDVEQKWLGRSDEIMVTDEDGVVFIATQPAWRLRTLWPLSAQALVRASRRYPGVDFKPQPLLRRAALADGLARWRLRLSADENGPERSYLQQQQAMADAGWTVHLLTPTGIITHRQWVAAGITTSIFAALFFLALYLRQRHKRRVEWTRYQEAAQQALQVAHDQLEQRVEERTAALRQAQDELIPAAKLAVIGQMSTGISHEINQPLAALRSYADNARLLLEQQRDEEVRSNLIQIAELTDRIAQISSQLKLFARKTSGERVAVSMHSAVDAALSILRPQLKKTATTLRIDLPEGCDQVLADPVQLEQILVNLLSNALNAMEAQPQRWVEINGCRNEGFLLLAIHDNGPGIAATNLARIFDPFFTTREAGLGLGLSISHRIAESMCGRLEAANHPQGGALFTLSLRLASAASNEAESQP
jgi:two-component system C4-dicarboxylate transport sensor histidine kinase DctB